ncbi:DUF4232 domain-containing protein [Streptomyces sp. NPDC048507]|uniref:DUF4232 domain-containing protein n=1 Tax=Streptomyces sp. NPDC048507 TaxID=3365560 RepID=UPI0037227570
MRTTRRGWQNYVLGAAAAAALLSSTACGPGSGDGDGAKGPSSPPASPSATSPATPGPTAPSGTGTPAPTAPARTPSAPALQPGTPGAAASCTAANIAITTTSYRQDSDKHLLLTATNTGDEPCTLYLYPTVRLGGDARDPVGPLESDRHAVATLAPHGKAYAGLRLYRVGEQLDVVTSLSVGFRDRDNGSDAGKPVRVPLTRPDFLNIGPTPGVTYWNTDLRVVEKYLLAT